MMPIGPLMIEHRLIEKMIEILRIEVDRIAYSKTTDPVLLDSAVDFIRTYADRTHHGKEEEILFRDLAIKDLSSEDRKLMDELINEHISTRQTVSDLVSAKERYLKGDAGALETIAEQLKVLIDLYPVHIEKEDNVFFRSSMKYFTRSEQDAMLEEMQAFDRMMIHEKYKALVAYIGQRGV
ncbi:MAG: hemerythrin domain-containing protein [Desulfococcaceae bacterium]